MATEPTYLLDTNILLRLSKRDDPRHSLVQTALDALTDRDAEISCTPQNVSEFWNVCTRPSERNGFGLSIAETDEALLALERTVTVLPDNDQIYRIWRDLVVRHKVSGVQVHDARLAAAIQAHGISRSADSRARSSVANPGSWRLGFLGTIASGTRQQAATSRYRSVRISGGHLAQVRSLRNRRRVQLIADWILHYCVDEGLDIEKGGHHERRQRSCR